MKEFRGIEVLGDDLVVVRMKLSTQEDHARRRKNSSPVSDRDLKEAKCIGSSSVVARAHAVAVFLT
jgi:hypothetical protein